MYLKKEYIGTPQKQAIPMYHLLQTYQIKQPALPLSLNSKRIAAQIIVEYIKTPQNQAIPMCPSLEIYQIKQPAMPHTAIWSESPRKS